MAPLHLLVLALILPLSHATSIKYCGKCSVCFPPADRGVAIFVDSLNISVFFHIACSWFLIRVHPFIVVFIQSAAFSHHQIETFLVFLNWVLVLIESSAFSFQCSSLLPGILLRQSLAACLWCHADSFYLNFFFFFPPFWFGCRLLGGLCCEG